MEVLSFVFHLHLFCPRRNQQIAWNSECLILLQFGSKFMLQVQFHVWISEAKFFGLFSACKNWDATDFFFFFSFCKHKTSISALFGKKRIEQ